MYTQFTREPTDQRPLAEQVANHFRLRIRAGDFAYGDVLPPADELTGASRMTVLTAYRQLAAEGMVRLRRAQGTVVTARQRLGSYAILIGSDALGHGGRTFINQLLAALIMHSPADHQAPRLYIINSPATPTDETDAYMPDSLHEDIERGIISGAFVWRPSGLRGVHGWLEDRNIPWVSMGREHLRLDVVGAVCGLLAHYSRKGLRRVAIWNTIDSHHREQISTDECAKMEVTCHCISVHGDTAVSKGRESVQLLLQQRTLPDALVVTDDVVGLTALRELELAGVRVPTDLRLGLFCHSGHLPEILRCCDRFVLDPEVAARTLHEIMANAVKRRPSPIQPVSLKLELAESSAIQRGTP